MRVFIILFVSLIILLANVPQTTTNDCKCECCTSPGCRPTLVGTQDAWFCSEATTCTQEKCIDLYQDKCPPRDAEGQTRAICITISGVTRTLSSLFLITGIISILLLIQDKL
jgi:hypothetical protein